MNRLTRKIIKNCGTPEDYCFNYLGGGSSEEANIKRMEDYVMCVKKVRKQFKIKSKCKE